MPNEDGTQLIMDAFWAAMRERQHESQAAPLIIADAMKVAAAEIDTLREAIRRLADQDATLSVQGGNVIVQMDGRLTDAEREALGWAIVAADLEKAETAGEFSAFVAERAATLRTLLERTK
jgi:hypothetical protein